MTVGYLGGIVFSVSSKMVKTFDSLKYTKSAKYTGHQRHNGDEMLEYTGRNAAEISFSINLSYLLGVKVEDELKKIDNYTKYGKILKFVLGKHIIGSYRWVITKYTVTYKHFDKYGEIVTADVSLSLKEYIQNRGDVNGL